MRQMDRGDIDGQQYKQKEKVDWTKYCQTYGQEGIGLDYCANVANREAEKDVIKKEML